MRVFVKLKESLIISYSYQVSSSFDLGRTANTVATCCQNIATNLSISSNCNMSVKNRLVATCQTCYKLLKQLAVSLWIIIFDNQLATSFLPCARVEENELLLINKID